MKKKLAILLTIFILPINVFAYSNKIIPGGNTIGITVSSKGVMVVGFYKVSGKYNDASPKLKEGDYITKINSEEVNTVDDLVRLIKKYERDGKIEISYLRNNVERTSSLNLIKDDGTYKTGIYVKDEITGIGTLSYIDPETKIYGALGHEVQESTTKEKMEIDDGTIFRNYITGITRSVDGAPGSKNAKFYNNVIYGNILKNSKYGIYGKYDEKYIKNEAVEIKKLSEVKLGKAYIRTVTKGEEIKDYEIEITNINKNSKLKSISFIVNDEKLLKESGGVVQGMSGSPIIQDGYLIGAVTHVLVENVESGYGISIITMLDEGDRLYEKINDQKNH